MLTSGCQQHTVSGAPLEHRAPGAMPFGPCSTAEQLMSRSRWVSSEDREEAAAWGER